MIKNAIADNNIIREQVRQIANWHHDRNLIDGATDQAQFVKLIEEAGELAGNIARGRDLRDDIGDIMVVLINIMERNGLTMQECLVKAWDDIKDRKGRMIDGFFVKEADLPTQLVDELSETERGSGGFGSTGR